MELRYELKKHKDKIYLAYVYGGRRQNVAVAPSQYERYIRKIYDEKETYNIIRAMRLYILMKLLPEVKSKAKAVEHLLKMADFEAVFWYWKFNENLELAIKSFKTLYSLR